MNIEIYKTYEIPDDYWKQIVCGFNSSFEGHSTTIDQIKNGAVSNSFGYSYHALCIIEEDKIIGFNSIAPNYYLSTNKEKIKVGLSGSTYVLEKYRKDIFILNDMFMALKKHCAKEDVIVILGVPNINSYRYFIKFLKFKEVFNLTYYILPKNIFNVVGNGKLSFLNIFSKAYSFMSIIFAYIASSFVNTKERTEHKYRIVQDETFLSKRFKDKKYKTINTDNISFTYVMCNEDNIKAVYLMHFSEKGLKSFKALVRSVYYIYTHENYDLIMYVGTMNFKQSLLLKVPRKLEPKKLPFTYNMLNSENNDDFKDMNIKEKWDFSLMNFDVR